MNGPGGLDTSVTEIDRCMIIALADEMTDAMIEDLMALVINKAYGAGFIGAVMNFSMVHVMDSYAFGAFLKVTKALSLMGVKTVWAGLNPGVVCALLDLDPGFDDVPILTALNLEQGIALLNEKTI